ncbi:energy transducer TonB [Flavobacterium sp.]|uniref:energy transducer TonB n=1 Tax=Flavobacterium sp. TaxID=239 RepID=UPI0025DD5DE4|nr:energy transducer TonB [Flavobacterium sp.]
MRNSIIFIFIAFISSNISSAQFICRISPITKKVGDEITIEKRNPKDAAIVGDYRAEGNGWILLPDHTGALFVENIQVNELLWVLGDIDGDLGIEITTLKDELSADNKLQSERQLKFLVNIKSSTELEFLNPLIPQTLKLHRTILIPGKVYSKIKSTDMQYVPRENVLPVSEANDTPKENPIAIEDQIYNTSGVDIKPEFEGGMEKFYKFIGQNFKVPDEEDLRGKIFVSFVVEKDGSLGDIKVIRDIGYGTGNEAIRVLKICPKWKPGELNGKKVRVLYSMPINI